jgi:hypothetical protein
MLEFIKKVSNTSVSSLVMSNIFSADYDDYLIQQTAYDDASSTNDGTMRLLDSGGTVITASEYYYAGENTRTYNNFSESNGVGETSFGYFGFQDSSTTTGVGMSMYVFKPHESSLFTKCIWQAQMGGGGQGRWYGGSHQVAETITGIQFDTGSGTVDIDCIVYGIKGL